MPLDERQTPNAESIDDQKASVVDPSNASSSISYYPDSFKADLWVKSNENQLEMS